MGGFDGWVWGFWDLGGEYLREKRGEIGLEVAKWCFLQKNIYLYVNTRYSKGTLTVASGAPEVGRFKFSLQRGSDSLQRVVSGFWAVCNFSL